MSDDDEFAFDTDYDKLNLGSGSTPTYNTSYNTQVPTASLDNLRSEVSDMRSELTDEQEAVSDFEGQLDAMERHLGEMNETLESRELNIHLVPPDTNISRLAIQLQLVVGVFVVAIALGRFFIPSSPFTYIGIAFGASIATNLITNKLYPADV